MRDDAATTTFDLTVPAAATAPASVFHACDQRALGDRWLGYLRDQVAQGQLADGTVGTYSKGLALWLAFLEKVVRTDRPGPSTVGEFLAAILPSRRPAAANTRLNAVRSFYRWAEGAGEYPNIGRSVRTVRDPRDAPLPALEHAQLPALVALVEGNRLVAVRDRALLLAMISTALRCVSLERAAIADLDLTAGTLRHRAKGRRSADCTAYLSPAACRAFAAYLAERGRQIPYAPADPLFIATDRRAFGHALTGRSMRRVVLALMERAGHARRGGDGRLIAPGVWSAHSIRRSALTTVADVHGIEAAQRLAGHASADTTRKFYARTRLDHVMRAVAATLDLPTNADD
ncbi:MAG TPA: tyrosine-type recombinase/integrase [Planctomycetota bacterium]|nr:tyrosine-type recombinase/integrase [Planctomycetota bacterium]